MIELVIVMLIGTGITVGIVKIYSIISTNISYSNLNSTIMSHISEFEYNLNNEKENIKIKLDTRLGTIEFCKIKNEENGQSKYIWKIIKFKDKDIDTNNCMELCNTKSHYIVCKNSQQNFDASDNPLILKIDNLNC